MGMNLQGLFKKKKKREHFQIFSFLRLMINM